MKQKQVFPIPLFFLFFVTSTPIGTPGEIVVNDGHGDFFLVPAGRFLMGDNYNEGNPRERPSHEVYLDSYYIGEFEVTNGQYRLFMDDGGYSNPDYWTLGGFGTAREPLLWNDSTYCGGGIAGNDDFPVVGVSWFEANAYCEWLTAKTGFVYRLPTEAEWEKAARGGCYLDGDTASTTPNPIAPPRRYPWGNNIDGSFANYVDSGDPFDNSITPVGYYNGTVRGNFPTSDNSSPYGAYDMAGNVYEWCSDYYGEDYYQKCLDSGVVENPRGPSTGGGYVIRGSAFDYKIFKQRCAYRGAYYPSFRGSYIGIRCVRDIGGR
jgi:formylglycine-generating enzyme required for sulfatase activity